MNRNKVLLIGVDQSIPYLLDKFVDEGLLPNIKNLIESGVYAEGLSCVPCDTPTNWTTIATGATTSVHGATSFYTHIPGEELDYGATQRSRSQLKKFTTAEYIWETADRHQIPSFIINYPAGWLANLKFGIMSAFSWPIPTILPPIIRSQKTLIFSTNSKKKKLIIRNNTFTLHISNNTAIKFEIKQKKSLHYGYSNHKFTMQQGQWSEWFNSFSQYRGRDLPVIFRFYLREIAQDGSKVELIISPLYNTHGWTSSTDFAEKLLKNIKFPEENPTKSNVGYTFEGKMTEVLEFARKETQAIANAIYFARKQLKWELCYFHVHHLDTINHNTLGHLHPEYPQYDEKTAEMAINHVQTAYSIVDDMVGILIDSVVDENTTVVYISDHGAIPCWRIANIVKPLVEAGLMAYRKNGNYYQIDWTKSQVFPYCEPTYIWINLKGRDPQGIVDQKDYESIRDHVIDVLQDIKDPENNNPIIDLVMRKEDHPELHQNGKRIGDVVYFLNPPYNIFDDDLAVMNAARTNLIDKPLCYNSDHIFGAHAYYLPTKRFGPFSNSVPIIFKGPSVEHGLKLEGLTELIHIAPTLSSILNIPPPAQSQGSILKFF
ncbi:MAG: alkaline phosphatase family protein [Candidatus Lokiarchaeota archaeon]|nr:alkaline phosphatase family protein [Candidatus Lokiarchaeota archaeon]